MRRLSSTCSRCCAARYSTTSERCRTSPRCAYTRKANPRCSSGCEDLPIATSLGSCCLAPEFSWERVEWKRGRNNAATPRGLAVRTGGASSATHMYAVRHSMRDEVQIVLQYSPTHQRPEPGSIMGVDQHDVLSLGK